MIDVDVVKINHWLNVRKVTLIQIKEKRDLYNKIKKKNFSISIKDLNFLEKYLNIQQDDILLKKNYRILFIFQKKKFYQQKDQLKETAYIFIIIIHYLRHKDLNLQ